MNREYKFRAWDNEKEMFVPQGEIIFKYYGETSIEVSPNCVEYIGDRVHSGEKQYSRFNIDQFINNIDKNSKEIYENDIHKDEYGDLWRVMMLPCGRYALKLLYDGYVDEFIDWKGCNIVGSIYEIPKINE